MADAPREESFEALTKNQAIAKALLIGAELERGDIVAHLDREANASKAPQNTVAWALAREIENGEHHGEH